MALEAETLNGFYPAHAIRSNIVHVRLAQSQNVPRGCFLRISATSGSGVLLTANNTQLHLLAAETKITTATETGTNIMCYALFPGMVLVGLNSVTGGAVVKRTLYGDLVDVHIPTARKHRVRLATAAKGHMRILGRHRQNLLATGTGNLWFVELTASARGFQGGVFA